MSNTREIWKPIRGFAGKYLVSNKGRVGSLYYYNKPQDNLYILKPIARNNQKHFYVYLKRASWGKWFNLSRLVANAFLPKKHNRKLVVIHKDRDSSNNRVANLLWGTPENVTKYLQRTKVGHTNIDKIKSLRCRGLSYRDIGKRYGVSGMAIQKIVTGKSYKWVR